MYRIDGTENTAGLEFWRQFLCEIWSVLLYRTSTARLAQSVEHETLNLRVVGSSPTLGDFFFVSSGGIYFIVVNSCPHSLIEQVISL
jgi:hypothetical protein